MGELAGAATGYAFVVLCLFSPNNVHVIHYNQQQPKPEKIRDWGLRTPFMYSHSSEAGGRVDLLRADVDAAPLAARGVRRAAWRGHAAPTASPGW